MYKVSVLVPVYGVEHYIERCARSLFEQTYPNVEYVFVNDCTPDRSVEMLQYVMECYPTKKDYVKIVNHNSNKGLAVARNTALEYATGEFICHVDSDDWIELDMIEQLVRRQQDTNADIVSCSAIIHYSAEMAVLEEPDYQSKDEMMQSVLQMTLDHVIWRRLIRTSLYKDNGIRAVEGVNIGEDHYTFPRLLHYADSFAKCDLALYHYNCTNDQSYMQSTEDSFNRVRYASNIASINILVDFFSQNASKYLDALFAIKTKYVYKNFFMVLKLGDKDSYNELCSDWESIDNTYKKAEGLTTYRIGLLSPSHYCLNRMRVFSRIIIKKIFGKRCYNL